MNYDNRIVRLEATLLPPSEPLRILRVIIDVNREPVSACGRMDDGTLSRTFDRQPSEPDDAFRDRVTLELGW